MICLSTISRLHAEKRAKLESLLFPDGLAPLPDDIKDILLLNLYADRYYNTRGDNITKLMWREMKVENYELFYLTGSFVAHNFTETYVDNSTFFSEGPVQNSKSKEIFSISSGENRKLFYPKIPYPIPLPGLIHPSHNRTNLIL